MKRPKLAALAFVLFTAWGGFASAATVDYDLSMPLADVSASDPTPTFLLRGTLSYDDDAMSGSGDFTFTNGDWSVTKSFAGFSFLLPYDDSTTGALFDGKALDGSELYFNVLANSLTDTIASGFVSYCSTGCMIFNSVGASITPATLPGVGLPGGIDLPGGVDLPGGGVSPVPLPPAVSLFGAALLGLAGLAAFRRRTRPAARTQQVAVRI